MYGGRRNFLFGLASVLAAPAWALPSKSDVDMVKDEVEDIVSKFLKEGGKLVAGIPVPTVIISFTPQLSWLDPKTAELHTAAWSQCPADMQDFFTSLLPRGARMSPATFFSEVFNAFLVPHEMSHFVDTQREVKSKSLYENEVRANRIAVAFWLTQPGGQARMEALMRTVAIAEAHLPNPVPAGVGPIAYFESHYDELGSNPSAYGWYQFHMFLEAWALRHKQNFSELLKNV